MNHNKFYTLLALQSLLKGEMIPNPESDKNLSKELVRAHNYRSIQRILGAFRGNLVYEVEAKSTWDGYIPIFPPEDYGFMAYECEVMVQLNLSIQYFRLRIGIREADNYWFCDVIDDRPWSDNPPTIGQFEELA